MRFQVLGPLSLNRGPESVVLRPSKPTVLLAALLLNANSMVSGDYLLRVVWGEEQPATAKAALQTCVLRLRRLFLKHGVIETPIDAVPGGYRITAGAAHLDLIGFRAHVAAAARAAGDPVAELRSLAEASALWQGPLLANVRSDVLHRDEVPRLAEERLRVVERACDLRLALGHCTQALVELWAVTRAHPGHERFREQLIEALYRTGRQAEALAEYQQIKAYLRDELGVDPSPTLQKLELAILRGDDLGPSSSDGPPVRLALPSAPADVPGTSGAAPGGELAARPGLPAARRSVDDRPYGGGPDVDGPDGGTPPPQPVEVHGVPGFRGRDAEVAALVERLDPDRQPAGEPVTALLCGAPGVGKTALAQQVAGLVRDRYPAGCVLLPTVAPDGTPYRAEELRAAVAALRGGSGGAADGSGSGGGGLLLVLDDVVDADQVRPLLPAAPGDAVLITSRMGLAGLVATHGGWVHRIGPFTPAESHRVLLAVLGAERVEAEPAAAAELAALCGHHPLALRILSARLLTRPGLRLADGVAWLGDDPLGSLNLPGDARMSVRRVFDAALDRLGPRQADVFLRVAALPADRFSAEEGAEVLGTPEAEAAEALEQLADAGFLEEGPPGPYRVHQLLGVYARRAIDSTPSRQRV